MIPATFSLVVIGSAFLAGVLMFFAPCTLPLVPAYLAFIAGVTQAQSKTSSTAQRKIIRNGLAFVLGFSTIFISLGILAGFFGSFIGPYRQVLAQIGGVIIILFGLIMLHILHVRSLSRSYAIAIPRFIIPGSLQSAFLLGVIFALGWTPCIGPVLASILLMATNNATIFSGAFLLLIFSFGLGLPFIFTAVLYTKMSRLIEKMGTSNRFVELIAGVLLIVIGSLIVSNNFGFFVDAGYYFFSRTGLDVLFTHF